MIRKVNTLVIFVTISLLSGCSNKSFTNISSDLRKVDVLSDVIKKEIFSIGKKDKKMGLELAKLYKKYFIEFFVRVKKMTKDSSLIETKKRDSRGTLRDYKKEYKKYGSSTKSKKYRAELNKYNRQQGTYGNGDGKDASHKGGKIVGFESQSKNRGRAEKSRLKK